MIQRRGFRYFLPIVLTAFYVALIHSGYSREQEYYQAVDRVRAEAIDSEEGKISLYDLPHLPPRGIQLALAINLPACLAASPFLLLAQSNPLTTYWIIGVPVPFLWLLVGRWIDRSIGWLPTKQTKSRSDLTASIFALCSGITAVLGGLLFAGLILGVSHHGLVFPLALAIWSLVGSIYFYVRAGRWTESAGQSPNDSSTRE